MHLGAQRRFLDDAARAYAACTPAHRTSKLPPQLRKRLPASKKTFAIPESKSYPIHDPYHATLALGALLRVAGRHGPDPKIASRVLAAVHKRWPGVYACERDLVSKIKSRHHVR